MLPNAPGTGGNRPMTRNRSNRGRNRRNRDRPAEEQGQDGAQAQEQVESSTTTPVTTPAPAPEQRRREADRPRGPRTPFEDRGPRPSEARPQAAQGEQGSGSRPGQGRGGRRRPQRRQQVMTITNEVLKPRAQVTGSREPIEKRTMEQISGPEGPAFGCPMLSRTRMGLPVTGGHPAPHCALAWAIHNETEASYCMETHDLTLCWKAHPEQLEEVRARLAEHAAAD